MGHMNGANGALCKSKGRLAGEVVSISVWDGLRTLICSTMSLLAALAFCKNWKDQMSTREIPTKN